MTAVAGLRLLARPYFCRKAPRQNGVYKCVGSHDSCHALPGGKVESKAGGSAWEDSDGALGRKALAAAATAVLAGLAF